MKVQKMILKTLLNDFRLELKVPEKYFNARNLSRIRFVLLGICTGYLLNLILHLFFPKVAKKLDNNEPPVFGLLALLFIIIITLGPILDVDRYKIKSKKKKGKTN